MEIMDIKPGTPIEFTKISTDEDGEKNIDEDVSIYISSVFGVTKNDEIVFHLPTKQGHTVTIPMNVPFNAVFNTGKGMFQLSGLITKRGRLENFPVYVFEPEGKLKKVQRRDYYRFNCYIPIKILPIPRDVAVLPTMELVEADLARYGDTYGIPVEGVILDISGGGARFNSSRNVDTDRFMYVSFWLESPTMHKQINTVARRVVSKYFDDLKIFEHRIEFLFKEQEDREIIIKYIFDEDRRLRKRVQR